MIATIGLVECVNGWLGVLFADKHMFLTVLGLGPSAETSVGIGTKGGI